MSAHGIYTPTNHPWNFQEQSSQAHGEGVLKPLETHILKRSHCQVSHARDPNLDSQLEIGQCLALP